MKSFAHTITDPVGLHARPAADLARFAASCASDVHVRKRGADKEVDAKSMLAIMSLGVRTHDAVEFSIEGETEADDAPALRAFCERTF
ncbi:Phosphotransferase system, phosphocarrier protein HPr [Coriobacterium glomerans PW2]|uniref:Phosphocarrier protein HPr n=2 Tax=Coriobacterium TaxID=33870 RepID=F2N895_CORGP|nr:HPr family phosphocarrier protein [Coriobacterium glomerans]AEB07278.1 Phosphotransferase system, phosphocarrier protein HPr [Coriobacterium glomerans PW2]